MNAASTQVKIYVFACGQGDTILLSLHDKWVLIDCHLPKGGVRDGFFAKLRILGVERLDVLCLTHPHYDHYHGMGAVVEYFTTEGRSLGIFCDSGLPPSSVINAMRRARLGTASLLSEHEKLYKKLSDLFLAKEVKYFQGNQSSRPLIRNGADEYLIPVGPSPQLVNTTTLQTVEKGDWTSNLRKNLNRLSLVLALRVCTKEAILDALLTADTDGEGCNEACAALGEYQNGEAGCTFDFVKVSHHGSLDSHQGSKICQMTKTTNRIAVICCDGVDEKLPDRVVMSAFLKEGWTVLPTTRRLRQETTNPVSPSMLTLSGECLNLRDQLQVKSSNLEITWSPASGISFEPLDAAITGQDVQNYGSAQKESKRSTVARSLQQPFRLL